MLVTMSEHSLQASKRTPEMDSYLWILWLFPDAVCWWSGAHGSWAFTWGKDGWIGLCMYFILFPVFLLITCFNRDSIHSPILIPDSASMTRSPTSSIRTIHSIAASPAMDLAQLSSSHRSAPHPIYLISKAIAPQSLVNHPSHPRTILKPWTIRLSKIKSISMIVATHVWSLPAVVVQWGGAVWWQICITASGQTRSHCRYDDYDSRSPPCRHHPRPLRVRDSSTRSSYGTSTWSRPGT